MDNNKETRQAKQEDEDVHFEREVVSTTASPVKEGEESEKTSIGGTTIPAEEELMGGSDFPPLSEQEKQPKLPDDERIRELNRKTSLGD